MFVQNGLLKSRAVFCLAPGALKHKQTGLLRQGKLRVYYSFLSYLSDVSVGTILSCFQCSIRRESSDEAEGDNNPLLTEPIYSLTKRNTLFWESKYFRLCVARRGKNIFRSDMWLVMISTCNPVPHYIVMKLGDWSQWCSAPRSPWK